jgi:hypothetical protein
VHSLPPGRCGRDLGASPLMTSTMPPCILLDSRPHHLPGAVRGRHACRSHVVAHIDGPDAARVNNRPLVVNPARVSGWLSGVQFSSTSNVPGTV